MRFDELEERLRSHYAERAARTLELEGFRRAAVLIPVLRRDERATLLFTRRSVHLPTHAGQISFPGGRVEAGEDSRDAALRETLEEVSIATTAVEIVGRLDDFPSISSYLVAPFIGLVREPPETFRLDTREVSSAFESPVRDALAPENRRVETWDASRLPPDSPRELILEAHRELGHLAPGQETYPAYFFDIAPEGRPVWGLTARILEDFLAPLREPR